MDLYILNEINKLKGGGSSSSASVGAAVGQYGIETSPDPQYPALSSFVSFYSENRRYHSDARRWDNSFPEYGNFYVYGNNTQDALLGFWNPTGQTRGSNQPDTGEQMSHRTECQAVHGTVGHSVHTQTMYSGEDYTPWSSNVMWIRNPTASNITIGVGMIFTNKWHNGYEGASLHQFVPDSINNSEVSEVQHLKIWGQTGNNSWYNDTIQNVTFPANKTVAIMVMANSQWWTSSSNGGLTHNVNHFHSLQNFTNAGLHCDQQMSQVYSQYMNNSYTTNMYNNGVQNSIYRMYNDCAKVFGDRTPA